MVDKIEKLLSRKVFYLKITFKLNPLKISQKSKKVVVLLCTKKKWPFKGSVRKKMKGGSGPWRKISAFDRY